MIPCGCVEIPVIIYFIVAFWTNMKNYIFSARRRHRKTHTHTSNLISDEIYNNKKAHTKTNLFIIFGRLNFPDFLFPIAKKDSRY